MRFPAIEPQFLRRPVVPVFRPERAAAQPVPEPEAAPRFLDFLDQLDPDQRVRFVGEW